jgi:hypothetical protein
VFRPRLFVLMLTFLAFAQDLHAEGKPAPFYSLPADGVWVEYEWKRTPADQKDQQGTMRLSSVGTKDVDGVRCRWIEITVEWKVEDNVRWQRRKLLVEEKSFADGKALDGCLRDCFHHDDANPNAIRLSRKRIGEFLRMGFPGDDLALREVKEKEEVQTGLGKFTARHVSVGGKGGGKQEYQAWLAKDVPFGVAKFEIREPVGDGWRIVFAAAVTRSGKDARSTLDETMAK